MSQSLAECFQLRADLIPMTVLKLTQADWEGIERQLIQTIKKAPHYFHHAPVVVDVSDLSKEDGILDCKGLVSGLKQHGIIVAALRGANTAMAAVATSIGLATLKSAAEKAVEKIETEQAEGPVTKIITKPIRAGTQVYAKGGDLIILAGVNPGAECFADGSIHVYGALRGRALAGANGDRTARIFCKILDAELIAIAGHYQIKENIKAPPPSDGMIQVFLDNQKIQVGTI